MPGRPEPVTFHSECWHHPEPIVPSVLTGPRKERPTKVKTNASEEPKSDSGSEVRGPCKRDGKPPMAGTHLRGPTKVLLGSKSI